MRNDPFVVVGLPRSRTAWLANFLTHGGRECRHEGTATMRSFDEVLSTLRQGIGLSDTMLGLRIEDVAAALPETRIVIVKRPLEEVEASMARIGYPVPRDILERMDAALERASWLPRVILLDAQDLDNKETGRWVFRHALRRDMPETWWDLWGGVNVQTDAKSVIDAGMANLDGVRAIYGEAL